LEALYPEHPLVCFGGQAFPIWAVSAQPGDQANLEAALGVLDTATQPSFDHYDQGLDATGRPQERGYDPRGAAEFQDNIGRISRRSRHNGPAYAFDRLRADGARLVLDARPGTYFDSVATSERLERELLDVLVSHPDDRIPIGALPRREWLHRQVARFPRPDGDAHDATVVSDGRFRAGALSVSAAMLVLRPDGGGDALLARRSAEVLTHPGFVHVAPSGLLAPPPGTPIRWAEGFSVRRTILQEFAEEILGLPDDDESEPGDLEIRYCGISVPLLTLRPEVCLLILFRDAAALRRRIPAAPDLVSWEYRWAGEGGFLRLRLDDDLRPMGGADVVHPARMVPHAAAALHLATELGRRMR
jgi:hypothetical protein